MTQLIADRRDIDFFLHEQMQVETLRQNPRFAEFNKKTVDMIVTEGGTSLFIVPKIWVNDDGSLGESKHLGL